jgi:hypothetical protein
LSARAAAQLEMMGFDRVYHYARGKVDWIVRGLPTEPHAPVGERLRALPYFVNNLAPGFRTAWIRLSRRVTVMVFTRDDVAQIAADAPAPPAMAQDRPIAVVLNRDGILLGAIDGPGDRSAAWRASDVMNPAPQTIRPDMTPSLAATLLRSRPYLLVTTALGRYVGRYNPRASACRHRTQPENLG